MCFEIDWNARGFALSAEAGQNIARETSQSKKWFPLLKIFILQKPFFVDFDRQQFKGAWLSCSLLLPTSFQEYYQDISKISSRYPQGEIYKIRSPQSL